MLLFFSGQRSMHRNLCYELLTAVYSKTDGLGMDEGAEVVYDCKTTMYTSKPIFLDQVCDNTSTYVRCFFNFYILIFILA